MITPKGHSTLQLNIDGVSTNTPVLVQDNFQETDTLVGRAFSELPSFDKKAITFSTLVL